MSYQDDLLAPPSDAAEWLIDTHAHPTDNDGYLSQPPVGVMVAMSTNARDQTLVRELALQRPGVVVPCFGHHPWFVHAISLSQPPPPKRAHYEALFGAGDELDEILDILPTPRSLEEVTAELRENLLAFPAALLGEVGLDRAFRIPRSRSADSPKPKLTELKTPLSHQLAVLKAQFDVAVPLRRNVSFHSVQAAGPTQDLIKQLAMTHSVGFRDINVSFHSCTLDPAMVKSLQKTHRNAYIGFSSTINHRHANHRDVIQAAEKERLLVESDWNKMHGAAERTWHAVRLVAEVHADIAPEDARRMRGAQLDEIWRIGAQRLAANWRRFTSASSDGEESE